MPLSKYGQNLAIDVLFGQNSSAPATLYFALVLTEPTLTTTGTTLNEPTGGSYARASVTNNSTNFGAASLGLKTNATTITFPTATANWGTVGWLAVLDASSGGNLIGWAKLSSRTVKSGQTPSFAAGSLGITTEA